LKLRKSNKTKVGPQASKGVGRNFFRGGEGQRKKDQKLAKNTEK